jgi:hypothetical protein
MNDFVDFGRIGHDASVTLERSASQPGGNHLPDLFIVGAAKCGTTALHAMLSGHPEVGMAAVKELHHFSAPSVSSGSASRARFVTDEATYLGLFPRGDFRVVGEASTSYLAAPEAPARIAAFNPFARIIIVLRDPVERAFSQYLMDVREGIETRDFADALEADDRIPSRNWGDAALYTELGMYADQVARYLATFGTHRVLLLESDRLLSEPDAVLAEVEDFLGVTPGLSARSAHGADTNSFAVARSGAALAALRSERVRGAARALLPLGARRAIKERVLLRKVVKPAVPESVRELLMDRYAPDIERLRRLTGRELASLDSRWPSRREIAVSA